MTSSIDREAQAIVANLKKIIPPKIDGKQAILKMKNEGSRNWRQMEWIGFWFEHLVANELSKKIAVSVGPTIGNTTFDLSLNYVWDLKAHPESQPDKPMILNDCEAVETCITNHSGFGFVVVVGHAEFDETGHFKAWHDALKGGRSKYEVKRISRGAQSRRRKREFSPTRIDAVFIPDAATLRRGLDEGWLGYFQKGMRNSNGTARRSKYQIALHKAPSEIFVARIKL